MTVSPGGPPSTPLRTPRRSAVLAAALTFAILPGAVSASDDGRRLTEAGVHVTQADIESGDLSLDELRHQGMLVFSTPFNRADGYGDGPTDGIDPISPGRRPTLQNNGTLLRVNGLDGQSCLECHSIVSHASVPPVFGIGGVGGSVSNAMFQPTTIDPDDDAGEGFARFDGRFINPPFLFGAGGVQQLAAEMTADLHAQREAARTRPGEAVRLRSKGVDFGHIVHLGVEGGFDTSDVEGVDDDLVVRPFGRKGEFATIRDFDRDALRFHFGIEPVEDVGADLDADGDGVANEIGVGAVSALEIFEVTLPRPVRDRPTKASRRGRRLFDALGCAACHRPTLVTRSTDLALSLPSGSGGPHAVIDLRAKRPGLAPSRRGGVRVPLFADLKRHYMGEALAESFGSDLDGFFTTARLWGVADTAPYLHDGRALTLSEAIAMHGGEAESATEAFIDLDERARRDLVAFLKTLRTPRDPTADLEKRDRGKRPERARRR